MQHPKHSVPCGALWMALLCGLVSSPAWPAGADSPGVLARYVAQPDSSFAWHEISRGRIGTTTYVELIMNSQTWRGIPWKHQLFLLRPANMRADTRQALLFIHGGRWKDEYETRGVGDDLPREAALFAQLAESVRAPLAVLRQVPFQPLFDRREDALIAFTFDQYLTTGDNDWPLLLPMVKSATRAMDVVQSFAKERWALTIDSFVVAGASKRGWTSWLSAAIDSRVAGVAPMVIDVLNMREQMALQRATWGEVSEEIRDYSDLDLPGRMESDAGQQLLSIVDPYSYRERLTQPKLILLSTNDRYWPLDALKLYWQDLPEPKRVLYVANQGHGLRDADRVIGALSALHRSAENGHPLPSLSWTFTVNARGIAIALRADHPARRVRVWEAHSDSRDFREARWTSHGCANAQGTYACVARRERQRYTAAFAEMSFTENEPRAEHVPAFSLSTIVCIAGPASKGASPGC